MNDDWWVPNYHAGVPDDKVSMKKKTFKFYILVEYHDGDECFIDDFYSNYAPTVCKDSVDEPILLLHQAWDIDGSFKHSMNLRYSRGNVVSWGASEGEWSFEDE